MSSSPISSSSSEGEPPATPYDGLAELSCPVTIILGTGSISVRQCLALERQTVLRLNESAGEELQLLVNGVQLALGEVAIIDTSTAIRVTDLSRAPMAQRRAS